MLKELNKKGLENETIILLAVAVAVIVLSFKFMGGVAEASEGSADVTACKGSVQRNANLHIRGFEFPAAITCPAQNIKITKTGDKDSKEQEKAKRRIANAMYDCWNKFGEGKLNLFSDEATYCTVCAFIDIKADKPVTGLPQYLMDEEIPDRSGRFYYDYLAPYNTAKAEAVLGQLKDNPVLTELEKHQLKGRSSYALLFVYRKGIDEIKKIGRHITAQTTESQAGYAIGVFGGGTAATGAFATLALIGVSAGPAGWVALGAGVTVVGIIQLGAFIMSGDSPPEWASYLVLREWDGTNTGRILKEEIGCTYYPAELEQR